MHNETQSAGQTTAQPGASPCCALAGGCAARANYPWWRKDYLGWPIETIRGKPVKNALRIFVQNIRKIVELVRHNVGAEPRR